MVMSFAKYLIPVLVFSASIRAEKEAVDGNTQDAVNKIMTNKLWQEIRKRVLDPPSDEDLFDGLGSQSDDDNVNGNCEFSVEEGIIIKTHDSINLGATFLISPHVNTRQACTKECCSNADCNVAVFKDKGPEYACYLFDCGTDNVCKYTSHPGFSSVHLPQRKTSNKQQEKHANDLEDLIDTSTTTTTAPTTRTTTTSTTASTTPFVPAPLFQPCQRRQDCVDSFAQCLENFCMCQDGYHAQEGVCRKDCNRFEFECANEGHPDTYYPQCIAIYDRCDSNGIKHCKDGSDEINCSIAPKKGNPQTKVNKDGEVDEKSSSGDKGHEVSSSSSSSSSKSSSKDSDKSQQQPPQESEIATDSEKQSPSEQGNSVPDTPEQGGSNVGPPDRTLQKGDDLVSSDRAAQGVDLVSPDRTSGGREGESVSGSKVMDDSPKGNADVDTAAKVTDQQDKHTLGSKNTSSDVSIEPAAHVQEVDEAAVDDASLSTGHVGFIHQSSKGAVIALALGLAITAMLLIFVGCRLRHVKKRLRRGRPMSSNEADYLINGMYL